MKDRIAELVASMPPATDENGRPTPERLAFELDCVNCPIETATQREWHACAKLLAAEVFALQSILKRADDAVGKALSDLLCADIQCWCFTRAAMKRPECTCDNCATWKLLSKLSLASVTPTETTSP